MSINNNTRYLGSGAYQNAYQDTDCMAFIRGYRGKDELTFLINQEMLHEGLTLDDVKRWIEIGNNLMFPCTYNFRHAGAPYYYRYNRSLNGKSVVLRKLVDEKDRYSRFDSKAVISGTVSTCGLDFYSDNEKRFTVRIIVAEGSNEYGCRPGQAWGINANDLILEENGLNLQDILNKDYETEMEEFSKRSQGEYLAITIKRNNAISPDHFLSILTFYRLLWSTYFKNIVKQSLNLIDNGIDPWVSISLAYGSNETRSYNGLSQLGYLFNDPEKVLEGFVAKKASQCKINEVFTNADLKHNCLSETELNKYRKKTFNFKKTCTAIGRSKYLTLNKEYLAFSSGEKLYVLDDSGKFKETKKEKFE